MLRSPKRGEVPSSGATATQGERALAAFFFPSPPTSYGGGEVRQTPQAVILAGETQELRQALAIQYAYNSAMRGCRSLILMREKPGNALLPPGPAPPLTAALPLMGFRYVSNGAALRGALAGLHDHDDLPSLIVVACDLSELVAGDGGGGSETSHALTLCLAHLCEAQEFCDRTLRAAGRKGDGGNVGAEGGHGSEAPLLGAGNVGCEMVVCETGTNEGMPWCYFAYQMFVADFLVLRRASNGSVELLHLNRSRCQECGSEWAVRFRADQEVEVLESCCKSISEDN